MRVATALLRSACLVLCASGGCASPEAGSPERAPHAAVQAQSLAGSEVVLDRREDGAVLLGRLEPAPPNSDADRVLVLRGERAGQPLDPSIDGARALDARFAADRIVVLGADHVLRVVHGGATVELDRAAEAPLSVVGSTVAYVRGEMPFFEVARADVVTGTARQLTQGMGPAWSPALSPDAAEIVFVSSVLGTPRLHRLRADGSVEALPASARSPSSPIAPRWSGDRLMFTDEAGTAEIELSTGRVIEGPR